MCTRSILCTYREHTGHQHLHVSHKLFCSLWLQKLSVVCTSETRGSNKRGSKTQKHLRKQNPHSYVSVNLAIFPKATKGHHGASLLHASQKAMALSISNKGQNAVICICRLTVQNCPSSFLYSDGFIVYTVYRVHSISQENCKIYIKISKSINTMAARKMKVSPTHLQCQGIYYVNLSDELKPAVVYTTEEDQEPSMSEPHMEADSFPV